MASSDAPPTAQPDTPMPTGSRSTERENTEVEGVEVSDKNPHEIDYAFDQADEKVANDGANMCDLYRNIVTQQLSASRWGTDALPGPVFKNLFTRLTDQQRTNFATCGINTQYIDCSQNDQIYGCVPADADKCKCDSNKDKCTALPAASALTNAEADAITAADAKTYSRTCSEKDCCDCDYCNVMLKVDMDPSATSRRRLQDTMPAKKSVHGTFGNFDESENLANGVHDELTKLMSKDFNHDGKLSLPEYEAYFAESQTVAHYMEGLYNNVPLPRARVLGDTETTDSYNLIMFVGGWSAILTIVLCFLLRKLNQLTSQLK